MTVSDAPSGEALLAQPKSGPWDVALLDLHLPGMDGIALLDRLRERQPTRCADGYARVEM